MKLQLNKDLLSWLCSKQSPTRTPESKEFIKELVNYLQNKGFEVTTDQFFNIYATKTKDPDNLKWYPCFVAHTDTAQDFHKDVRLIEQDGILTGWDGERQVGPGFDDKVGICISLQLAEQFDNVKLFFPSDEESGCMGTKNADLKFFSDVSFCAQPDRRGDCDFIYYTNGIQVASEEFLEEASEMMQDFNYQIAIGVCTDVGELVHRGIGICCFNISCGYYNEHTYKEYLNIAAAEKCLNFLFTFTKFMTHRRWEYVPEFAYSNFDSVCEYDKLVDLTADLLYELEYVPNLPKQVRLIINKLNNLIYGYHPYNKSTVSRTSEWEDMFSNYGRWDYLDV